MSACSHKIFAQDEANKFLRVRTKSSSSFTNDGRKKRILRNTKIDRSLNFYAMIMKGGIKVSTNVLIMEKLHRKVIQVERILKRNVLNEL